VRTLFGPFTLDTEARQLRRGGQAIHLSPKAFDVLSALVEARPGVIDKSALHARIWPGTFVVDANLSVLIAEIRRALGDTPKDERFIRTVHRVGYAFCAPATADADALRQATAESPRCWLVVNDRHLVLPPGTHDIGRDPACAVWIEASGVSRRHARIHIDSGGTATVEDLGSTNGTFLKGVRVDGAAPLSDGDAIQIGAADAVFRSLAGGRLAATERIRRG
jgi:DNA-binding winged helix-turn-helix (wHTH) protein